MSDDIFDTEFEGKDVELDDNRAELGEDINLFQIEPTLRTLNIGAGWDVNTFDSESMDLDISLFLLDRNQKTRVDADFIFYNQPEALDGGIKHGGDTRLGAGEGDDENIIVDLQAIPFDILQVPIVLSIYKGFEKGQKLESVRNAYVRILNNDSNRELVRFELKEVLHEKTETGAIVGWLNREGPKWHFKADVEYIPGGLGEIARRYDIIVNQE